MNEEIRPLEGKMTGLLSEVSSETARLNYLLQLPAGPLRQAVEWDTELGNAADLLERVLAAMKASSNN
jgi:hypothetical protein